MTVNPQASFFNWFNMMRKRRGRMTILLDLFCRKLVDLGVDIDRASLHVPQLDPQWQARSLIWDREAGGAMEIGRAHGIDDSADYIQSPIRPILLGEEDFIKRTVGAPGTNQEFPILDELAAKGFTAYYAFAVDFSFGQHNAMTLATKIPGGLREEDRNIIRQGVPYLGALLELRHLHRTAAQLLDTYIGHFTGEKVLEGAIKRGAGEILHAVLWTCDLRAFTEISEREPLEDVIVLLDDYFEAVGRPVEDRGGEILKFIGDALLAIFPLAPGSDERAVCAKALAAAEEAVVRLAAISEKRIADGKSGLACGIALHLGDVMYGNIGTVDRLDFTVIGPAVNLVSRIEGVTRGLEPPIAFSAAFSERLDRPVRLLGRFPLKGIAGEQEVFVAQAVPLNRDGSRVLD